MKESGIKGSVGHRRSQTIHSDKFTSCKCQLC